MAYGKLTIHRLFAVACWLAAPAVAAPAATADFPAEVSQALASPDCDTLSALYRRHDSPAVARALAQAILGLPRCGQVGVELLRAEPIGGTNFFDPGGPARFASDQR